QTTLWVFKRIKKKKYLQKQTTLLMFKQIKQNLSTTANYTLGVQTDQKKTVNSSKLPSLVFRQIKKLSATANYTLDVQIDHAKPIYDSKLHSGCSDRSRRKNIYNSKLHS
ncbi:hypothetical protein ACJMK2_006476, partial [Sinanodonta woodiana]